jgi:hypothetical protein
MHSKSTMGGTMMTPQSELEEIQLSIQAARDLVEKRDALITLSKNEQFKKMILEGYLKNEAVRLAQISGEYAHREYRGEIMGMITGISYFNQWIEQVLREGDNAEEAIREHEQAMQDVLEEMEFDT